MFIVLTVILVMSMAVRVGSLGECVCASEQSGLSEGRLLGVSVGKGAADSRRNERQLTRASLRQDLRRADPNKASAEAQPDRSAGTRATANLRHTHGKDR